MKFSRSLAPVDFAYECNRSSVDLGSQATGRRRRLKHPHDGWIVARLGANRSMDLLATPDLNSI
jgi:hypothetical protein